MVNFLSIGLSSTGLPLCNVDNGRPDEAHSSTGQIPCDDHGNKFIIPTHARPEFITGIKPRVLPEPESGTDPMRVGFSGPFGQFRESVPIG